ncbi:alpha/beta-hydrolase [Massarina eburnea CBS 473.64]|uniref:Alpha/beta-hydrolase n=1 Tax=Massarina eburnea CBS 473.64 TaxID=1395130 RepID=A0A6A6RXL2_9PLEO|nr:alpha/beta-hydrolase [Massarina eburnea CBS 473.64]
MTATTAIKIQDTKFQTLGLTKATTNKEQVVNYTRALNSASAQNPILVLIHGYPESSYMWRHIIPLLPSTTPLFVPDLPGYGASAPIEKNDKLSVGTTLIAALKTEVQRSYPSDKVSSVPVILVGHDRGARVAQQLAVSGVGEGVEVLGVCLIDIVPITTQWAASSSAAEVVGYFHWPFLANVDLANRMIGAFGGANWCREMILKWAGKSEKGLKALEADDSLSVYTTFMSNPSTINATNQDYEAGATVDVSKQKDDQANGRKIKVPLLLIYSEAYIGKRYNFSQVWKEWVDEGVRIESVALGNGVGHFGAEEAPEESAEAVNAWVKGVVG